MSVTEEAFVSLARVLRADLVPPGAPPVCEAPTDEPLRVAPVIPLPPEQIADNAALARDVRIFRARVADAFDSARDSLLREFACAILGRELVLAPPDIAAIATRVLAEHPGTNPLRLRVATEDVAALAALRDTLPHIIADAELASGDVVVECSGGSIDARLGVRLAALLERT